MISVCIPTYNGEKFILDQLTSILSQLGKNDEVIISDDGSTDNTIKVIQSLRDERVKIYYNNEEKRRKKFKGYAQVLYSVSRNMNNALSKATGEYIFLSDQDDIWLSEKVKVVASRLLKYDLVVHDCSIFDERNNVVQQSYFNLVKPSASYFRTIQKSSFHGCCMAFNRKLLKLALPLPDAPLGHDTWLGLTAVLNGSVFFEKNILLLYRRHQNNVSTSSSKSNNSLYFKIWYRLMLVVKSLKLIKVRERILQLKKGED